MDEKIPLGRTGLQVSQAGLGCGGHSRLGMRYGNTEKEAEAVVKHALSLGINFFDTARAYGTEEVVGRAVASCRSDVVISTKTMFRDRDGNYMPTERLIDSLEKSLIRMNTDYVDVFSFHGVTPEHLPHCLNHYVPELQKQLDAGKIRHLGITESFRQDPTHDMLCEHLSASGLEGPSPRFTADMATAHDSVKKLAGLTYETLVFGHGDPIDTGASQQVADLATGL